MIKGINDKLLSIDDNGKKTEFEYDTWDNLSKTLFADGKIEHRNPDKSGNLFESLDRMDRKYAKGGQLIKTENWEWVSVADGNKDLISFRTDGNKQRYGSEPHFIPMQQMLNDRKRNQREAIHGLIKIEEMIELMEENRDK